MAGKQASPCYVRKGAVLTARLLSLLAPLSTRAGVVLARRGWRIEDEHGIVRQLLSTNLFSGLARKLQTGCRACFLGMCSHRQRRKSNGIQSTPIGSFQVRIRKTRGVRHKCPPIPSLSPPFSPLLPSARLPVLDTSSVLSPAEGRPRI
ncbi:hypothetical protein B0T26DRAFT_709507 [Lasiosphaeria miniovina]|uniref:Secreted protein n=1 Tax=Lasiosphaeria miniovina TaxID=1954250 RepID=A0AA40AK34_9PEZI|nr:uncharacterized protein B0T26DRAFT_709507 [Lasiosphaeria miniovina]KAK0717311.1 hypothetical protein B0T26DRAFT_709507 [Lasiosphaeria miniovina]